MTASALQLGFCQLPSLFVVTSDPKRRNEVVRISCGVSPDGNHLSISAVDSSQMVYNSLFGETELEKIIKENALDWKTFFQELEYGFIAQMVKVSHDPSGNLVCFVGIRISGKELRFSVAQSFDDAILFSILERLCEFFHTRSDPLSLSYPIEEMQLQEAVLQTKMVAFNEEKEQIKEAIAICNDEVSAMVARSIQLEFDLKELTQQSIAECKASGKDFDEINRDSSLDPNVSGCVGRVPFPFACRPFNTNLLKLIKSRFRPASKTAEAYHNDSEKEKYDRVVIPITIDELSKEMKVLPERDHLIVNEILKKIDQWDFDVWTVQDHTDKGALFYVAYALFVRHGFPKKFNIDEQILLNFFSQVEAGYHPNPYHNSMHGADVVHVVHFILSSGGLKDIAQLSEEDALAALIAGMIHDYDHPGLNNNFHIKVQSYLAVLYNDRSILENHHCAEVFELMKNPLFDILASLSESQRRDVRETMIDMVLSTDMQMHGKIYNSWKKRILQDHDLHMRKDDQRLALAMTIKMADISNCGRPLKLYLKWGTKLCEEFFLQGDSERNRGDPVSPYMDRFSPSLAKSQIAFMNYVVLPMFESISEFLPVMHFTVEHCETNKSYWTTHDDTI